MKISLIVIVALVSTVLMRRRSAAARHWVLAAAIGCAAVSPVLETMVPSWDLPFGMPSLQRADGAARRPAGLAPRPASASTSADGNFSSPTLQTAPGTLPAGRPARLLTIAWLTGASLGLFVLVVGLGRLAWLASRAQRISTGRWVELAAQISGELGWQRPVVLLQSDHPTLLVTWGLARPKVILPAAAREWADDRMRIVLCHELAHIRRGDWCMQMTAELLRAVYWFNPLLWLACRRLRQESEQACDDAVLERGVNGPDYATELLGLARDLKHPSHLWLPAPAMARPSSLERRVSAMLNARIDRRPVSRAARLATVLALLVVTIPIAAAQTFATFSGSVVDVQGLPLPNVTLILSNDQRQSKYEIKSNATGTFEFVGLPAGSYALEGKLPGFATLQDGVSLSGQNLQRRYTLQVGLLQESINVVDDGRSDPPAIKQRAASQPAAVECTALPVGGNIRAPRKIRDLAPEYPAGERGAGADGLVVMDGIIGLDGFIRDIRVHEPANPNLANAAVTAVREWQYTQTILNCSPIEVSLKITTKFSHRQ